jgi:hypothetical protein
MKRRPRLRMVGPDPADIFNDLDKLGADSALPQGEPKATAPRKQWHRYGTMVPREWELRLKRATRVSTYHLAHELLYRHWRAAQGKYGRDDGPVIVSSELAKAAGLSARSTRNALRQLEQFGLIAVARASRKSPRAFLLLVPMAERSCR